MRRLSDLSEVSGKTVHKMVIFGSYMVTVFEDQTYLTVAASYDGDDDTAIDVDSSMPNLPEMLPEDISNLFLLTAEEAEQVWESSVLERERRRLQSKKKKHRKR